MKFSRHIEIDLSHEVANAPFEDLAWLLEQFAHVFDGWDLQERARFAKFVGNRLSNEPSERSRNMLAMIVAEIDATKRGGE